MNSIPFCVILTIIPYMCYKDYAQISFEKFVVFLHQKGGIIMLERWSEGFEYLLSDDLVSYYSFFNAIFAEIAFLWGMNVEGAPLYTTLLLACIANVLIIAFLKKEDATDVVGKICCAVYCLIYLIIFTIGCRNNFMTMFVLFVIPFAWAGLCIIFRSCLSSIFVGYDSKFMKFINFIQTPFMSVILELAMLLLPIILIGVYLAKTEMAVLLNIALPLVALLVGPIWAYVEDSWATQNIFELAYENF